MKNYLLLFLSFFLFLQFAVCGELNIIYVDRSATGANNGTSWQDAFLSLQDALDSAKAHDHIWVARGTYFPEITYGMGSDLQFRHFRLKNSVEIYGGFAGNEREDYDLSRRDFTENETILSGVQEKDNSYHVFYNPEGTELNASAVLDGFTITAGRASGEGIHGSGGGMYIDKGSPTLRNLLFLNNEASDMGGGLYVINGSPALSDVTFAKNTAKEEGGGGMAAFGGSATLSKVAFIQNESENIVDSGDGGGGLLNAANSSMQLSEVQFIRNVAGSDMLKSQGGGMSNLESSPVLTGVVFEENSALGGDGGGLYNDRGSPELLDVVFAGNQARRGGGIFSSDYDGVKIPVFVNIFLQGNTAIVSGGGMYNELTKLLMVNALVSGNYATQNGGGVYNRDSDLQFVNVTVSGNQADSTGGGQYNESSVSQNYNCIYYSNRASSSGEYHDDPASASQFSHSIIRPVYSGPNNDYYDPEFVDPREPGLAPTVEGDYRLQRTSKAIDIGTNVPFEPAGIASEIDFDILHNPRLINWNADKGAYEYLLTCYLLFSIEPNNGRWSYDGGENWIPDKTLEEMLLTDYTITFEELEGWDAPEDIEFVDLNPESGETIEAKATYQRHTGELVVYIDPEEARDDGARWRVGTGSWRESGYIMSLPTGEYTVEFNEIVGWLEPDPAPVTINAEMQTSLTREYTGTDTGTLVVEIYPEDPRHDGAQWSVDGTNWYDDKHSLLLTTGDYTVQFSELDDWNEPDPIETAVVKDTQTTEEGTYTRAEGTLVVTIEPEAARDAGAQWSIDGSDWNDSGDELTLETGDYTVQFNELDDWNEPDPIDAAVVKDTQTTEEGTYTRAEGTLVVTIEPAAARDAGAQWSIDGSDWNDSGDELTLETGDYTVQFNELVDWNEPDPIDTTVVKDTQTTEEGTYTIGGETHASFQAIPLEGVIPLTVTFTDESTGNITDWSWDFGDGNTSTDADPVHEYTQPGSYTVSLTVSNPSYTDTLTRYNYILAHEEDAQEYDSEVVECDLPARIPLGRTTVMTLTLLNTGTEPWKAAENVYLGAVGDNDPLALPAFLRVLQEEGNVYYIEEGTFVIELYPEEIGVFTTEWQMINEGQFWFGDVFSQEVEVYLRTDVNDAIWHLFE